ncbi:thiolase domain-containing protein [Candidatus Peregrinibacteria bacterium]|nr:thiolase domain-containing protein [Candidatus Peregrinibacteria bacterium]
MNSDIRLIGYGQTRFGELWDMGIRDLMEEAADAAISSAPITALDIDMIIVSNMLAEITNGQAHLSAIASSLLPHHPPALRVESACGSGAFALHTACAMLESGRARNVLVIGAEKMTDVSNDIVSSALMGAADAEQERPAGLTFPGIFGMIAQRYMHEYGLSRAALSLVSAVHHRNACGNSFAQFRTEVTPDDVSGSAPVADPLRLLDCSPISDGAAACVLSTDKESPVRIAASQIASDSLSIVDRPVLTSFSATKDAAERSLAEAEVKLKDIRIVETHDCFSIAALINLEDLGFADPGGGIRFYRNAYEGQTAAHRSPGEGGALGVNMSGGLKGCGHPVGATGIKQIIDVAKRLRETGERYGLAHNFGGACATCGVHVLEHSPS